jgi:hypothetical protein
VFFGVHCLLLVYLLFRSNFFPRILGAGFALGGLGYIANGLALAMPRALAVTLFPYALLPAGVAEIAFAGWLIVVGLDASRWEARRVAAATGA